MGYNTKNYTEQGGDKTVIGGEITIAGDGKLTFEGDPLSKAFYQSDSEAVDTAGLVSDFNKLLGKLRTAGVMLSDAPLISILTQPEDVAVIEGSITESLTLEADVTGGVELSYQWYSNTSNTGGTLVSGATSKDFSLPTDLIAGTYYYYCVLSADEAQSETTTVATVTVNAA